MLQREKLSETAIQTAAFTWFHNTYPQYRGLLFSVPNGGRRNKREAARLKYEGLTPGVPDMLFMWNGRVHGFEFKTEQGVWSDEQRNIAAVWYKQRIHITTIRSVEFFQERLEFIMSTKEYIMFVDELRR